MKNLMMAALLLVPAAPTGADEHAGCPARAKSDRRAEVDQRHDEVTHVSHQRSVHHFLITKDGGTIRLEVTDRDDVAGRDRVRGHLRHIASAFAAGDFALPMLIHAETPPGAAVMKQMKEKIGYAFGETDAGGEVRIATGDPQALAAVHAFLRYQIEDHGTGDPLD